MAGVREDVTEALRRAVGIAGPEVLQQPKRLRAMLSDLVGQPTSDHRSEIQAVVAAAEELAGNRHRSDAGVVAGLAQRGIDNSTAKWALSALQEHGAGTEHTPSAPAVSGGRRRWLWVSAACLLVVAPLAVWLLRPGPDPDPEENGQGSEGGVAEEDASGTSPTTTTTPAAPSEVTGFRVEFEPAVEGAFRVSRTWEISDGRVTGTVSLTGADAGPALHRELIPAEAFTDPVFTSEPNNLTGDVAAFTVDLSGDEAFQFTFEAELTVPEPDKAEVDSWVATWQAGFGDLWPLDEVAPPNATVTPLP